MDYYSKQNYKIKITVIKQIKQKIPNFPTENNFIKKLVTEYDAKLSGYNTLLIQNFIFKYENNKLLVYNTINKTLKVLTL